MRRLLLLLPLALGLVTLFTIDHAVRLHVAVNGLLRDQLRTPDMERLRALVEAHDDAFSILALIVLGALVLIGILALRLRHKENEVGRRLEAALAARAEADAEWRRLDEAIETLTEGFVIFDENDRLVRANQKYREFYALSAPWIVPGAAFADIVLKGALAGQYQEARDDPRGWVEERMSRRSQMRERGVPPFEQHLGDGRWLKVSDRALSNGWTVGIRADITEFKRHVAALERAREDLRVEGVRVQALAEANRKAHKVLEDAIAALSEGFALWDGEDRLVACNASYAGLCPAAAGYLVPGVHYANYIGRVMACGQIDDGGDREGAVRARLHRRRHGAPEGYIEQLGDGRWVRLTNGAVEGGGVVTVLTDITELKAREIELTAARNDLEAQASHMRQLKDMAEAANRAKSGFLAMISHEIRTPMNAVLGLGGLLSETALTAEQRRYLDGIEESGNHLVGLINDLLDFSRLEAEKTALEPAPVSLRALISRAARMMAVLAQKKGLALNVEVQPDLPDGVELDAARFNQVLINLIGNAIKFTDRGYVTLRAEGEAQGVHLALRLTVSDTGSGVPADVRQRLFKPFERAQMHDHGLTAGTGLGLAITARLIQMMGGSIRLLDTAPGASFEITLDLMLADVVVVEPAVEVQEPLPTASLRVLVAEDTPASQLVIRTLLEKRGHQVRLVDNGTAALEAARAGGFDLVLLDRQMPGLSGLEVARAIRALPPPASTMPIVALSAQAFPADKVESMAAGFNDHLGKPLQVAELDRLIARVGRGDFEQGGPVEADPAAPLPPPSEGQAASVRAALDELSDMSGTAMVIELIDCALANIDEEQEALAQAGIEADLARMRQAAHKLAGVLAQYGARESAGLAARFERLEESLLSDDSIALRDSVASARALLEAERRRRAA